MSTPIPYELVSEWIYETMEKKNRHFCENDYIRAQSEIFTAIDKIINEILDNAEEAKKFDDFCKKMYEDGITSEYIQTYGIYHETNEELIESIKEGKRRLRELKKKTRDSEKEKTKKKVINKKQKSNVRKKEPQSLAK